MAEASSKQVPNDQESHAGMGNDWKQGYGFQFWRCAHNAFRGDGAGSANMQAELDAIWDKLLPAFQAKALAEDPAAQAKLKEQIGKLEVREK